ncbi:anthranilate phosphoribosyltransferase [Candidatus Omnitrophus magneticus]|uniref:Anthranilate phosphoribosyltransferase n=1 Tax=Candidatus Omnitrophus magneticus TaxID=1609969 RepID=A0A0F0CU73_9BACT|nr:anthranilate phosphoribosyltransferase [Candidatus Omnitrophus magneticus]
MDIKDAIKKVTSFENLSMEESLCLFRNIMEGTCETSQIAAIITAFKMKGETSDEIAGACRALREKALKINVRGQAVDLSRINFTPLLDTCGTGGSGIDIFNVSTTVSFIMAGIGIKVAKHGNRGVSSKSGSADVLEQLGVKIDVSPSITEKCIDEIGIGFLFAPLYHTAMKYASTARRDIGVRTIFNIIGPLSNPAFPNCQIIGVYDASLTEKISEVADKIGISRSMVVHGLDGLDELTISDKTKITETREGNSKTYYLGPEDFGIKRSSLDKLYVKSASESADMIKYVLKGGIGPARDIVLLNAALILILLDKSRDFIDARKIAEEAIDSGKAIKKLEELIKMTNAAE